MKSPLISLVLLLVLVLEGRAQTFAEGDIQVSRKAATAGFAPAELTFGTGLSTAYNAGTKTITITGNTGTVTSVALTGTDGIDIDSGSPITTTGTIALGINATTLKTHLTLNNVENTALSTWTGSTNLTTLGVLNSVLKVAPTGNANGELWLWDGANGEYSVLNIADTEWTFDGEIVAPSFRGAWAGSAIADAFIASAATWNAKQAALVSGTNIKTVNGTSLLGSGDITITGGITDGDKGDITVTSTGATWTIDNQAVTFAKMQHISTAHLLGRHSSGSGDVQQITIDGGLELQGANLRRAALIGEVTASAGSNTTTIANDAVTYAKMQNVSAASVLLGRGAGFGSGDVQQITLGTGLAMNLTTLSVSNIQASQITGILPSDQLQSGGALATISEIVASGAGGTGVNQTWRNEQRPGYGTGERLTWFSADGAYVLNWVSTTSTWYLAVYNGADLWTSEDDVDYPWQITNWTTDTGIDPPPTFTKAAFADFVRSDGNGSALTNLNANNISTGTLGVANGGTGATTLTANNVLLGNGTSALQTVAPGTTGNVLTSNGTTWTSTAPAPTNPAGTGSELQFRSSGTAFGAVTGSTVSGSSVTLTGAIDAATIGAALEREMVRPATWQIPWRSDLGTSTTAGSGSVTASNWSVNCQTGTTVSSRAQRALILAGVSDTFTAGPNVDSRVIDWSKRVTVGFAFNLVSASTNGQVFVRIGNNCSTSGNLSGRGMGIRINNTALVAQCHNGTTLNTSATLKTNTAGTSTATVIVLQSDGAGNVAVYVDNALAVTLTGGPTAAGFATDFLAVEALNNADASSTRVHVSPIKYYTTY
jgi:hypothetical protein